MVRHQTKNRQKECRRALQIEHSEAEYAHLRAEALAPHPQARYRLRSPESVGSHVAGPSSPPPESLVQVFSPPALAPPVFIDISLDSKEEDLEEPPMGNSN
ncbi:hypothetical protein RHGRI_029567 [Rhododendron griersonianum]|uniref:Uncharacterized protein n=1 Tax=Rhododendron griersonianum TaxID=479676 RepID=A0AAV6IM73_9ERIC|nr:hypothetical protein RHGRI_029567 [Rhododendron griersonianum]